MHLTDVDAAAIVFATAIVVATLALGAAALDRVSRRVLLGVAVMLAAAAAATWVLFALDPIVRLAVRAGGTTATMLVAVGALALHRALERVRRVDLELERAKAELDAVVARELELRAQELDRALARARSESISRLAEEERRIAEERRREVAEREREANAKLSATLTDAQRRLEARLSSWAGDLERAQQGLAEELARLSERQKTRMAEIEAQIGSDAESLESAADEQKALVSRLREDLERAARDAVQATSAELEQHAAERRRALHEVAERLRRRERELSELIDREEANATERIQVSLGDVERRQVEALQRVLQRESARFAEAGSQQFDAQIKRAREEAARRLGRELDIAVERFAREAHSVLAERMVQVGDASAQSVDRRLGQFRATLDRQRDELVASLESRIGDFEAQLRDRMREVAQEAEAERLAIEARLHDVARRVDDLLARTR